MNVFNESPGIQKQYRGRVSLPKAVIKRFGRNWEFFATETQNTANFQAWRGPCNASSWIPMKAGCAKFSEGLERTMALLGWFFVSFREPRTGYLRPYNTCWEREGYAISDSSLRSDIVDVEIETASVSLTCLVEKD